MALSIASTPVLSTGCWQLWHNRCYHCLRRSTRARDTSGLPLRGAAIYHTQRTRAKRVSQIG